MTVKELKDYLETVDDNTEIVFFDKDDGFVKVNSTSVERFNREREDYLSNPQGNYYFLLIR